MIHPELKVTEELAFTLQHSGFQVMTAVEKQQAMAEIYRRPPDVIIMAECDQRANEDGLCVLHVRELCQIPIIVLGRDMEETSGENMLNMGADAYLTNPLNFKELLARVRALIWRTQVNAMKVEGG